MPSVLAAAPHRGIGYHAARPDGRAALYIGIPTWQPSQKHRLALGRAFNASAHQLSGSGRVQRLRFQMTHS